MGSNSVTAKKFKLSDFVSTPEKRAEREAEAEKVWHANRFRRFAGRHDWHIPYRTRVAVLTRASDHCELCGKFCNEYGGTMLDLHHLTYERVGSELPEDLQAICRDCHDSIHGF